MEHGKWPISLTKFGNVVYVLADFVNRNTGGQGNFYRDRYLTDILK